MPVRFIALYHRHITLIIVFDKMIAFNKKYFGAFHPMVLLFAD